MSQSRLSLRHLPVVPEDFGIKPNDLLRAIARLISTWPGIRNEETPFLCAANIKGAKPPLFWVTQSSGEFRRLAEVLPEDQPLYCLKSAFMGEVGFRLEDTAAVMVSPFINAISDAFLKDIRHAAGGRPFLLAGNCAGSVSTLDMALRPDVHPEMLILLNYPLPPRHYSGPVELLFGQQEWDEFREDPGHLTCFPQAQVTLLAGAHGTYFVSEEIFKIADVINRSVVRLVNGSPATPQAAPEFPRRTI